MGLISDVRQMQAQGKSDSEIIQSLQSRGMTLTQISDALNQAKIKEAVAADAGAMAPGGTDMGDQMQPSLMGQQDQGTAQEYDTQAMVPQQSYGQQYDSSYGQYQPMGIGADTITEIAEQVTAEKIAGLKDDLEKVIDMRTSFEAKIDYIDERLKRIEKIIDKLQLAILQKVGDYVTNVEDIKKEMQEMQKSFSAVNRKQI